MRLSARLFAEFRPQALHIFQFCQYALSVVDVTSLAATPANDSPMVYWPKMSRLVSPRPRAVTAAAILAAVMGCYWLSDSAFALLVCREAHSSARIAAIVAMIIVPCCLGL